MNITVNDTVNNSNATFGRIVAETNEVSRNNNNNSIITVHKSINQKCRVQAELESLRKKRLAKSRRDEIREGCSLSSSGSGAFMTPEQAQAFLSTIRDADRRRRFHKEGGTTTSPTATKHKNRATEEMSNTSDKGISGHRRRMTTAAMINPAWREIQRQQKLEWRRKRQEAEEILHAYRSDVKAAVEAAKMAIVAAAPTESNNEQGLESEGEQQRHHPNQEQHPSYDESPHAVGAGSTVTTSTASLLSSDGELLNSISAGSATTTTSNSTPLSSAAGVTRDEETHTITCPPFTADDIDISSMAEVSAVLASIHDDEYADFDDDDNEYSDEGVVGSCSALPSDQQGNGEHEPSRARGGSSSSLRLVATNPTFLTTIAVSPSNENDDKSNGRKRTGSDRSSVQHEEDQAVDDEDDDDGSISCCTTPTTLGRLCVDSNLSVSASVDVGGGLGGSLHGVRAAVVSSSSDESNKKKMKAPWRTRAYRRISRSWQILETNQQQPPPSTARASVGIVYPPNVSRMAW